MADGDLQIEELQLEHVEALRQENQRLREELQLFVGNSIKGTQIFCVECGQGFSRAEHLDRHLLTHNGRKPYECLVCRQDFARKDLLKRHLCSIHGCDEEGVAVSQNEQKSHPKTAGRTRSACQNCAGSKTKCDLKNNKSGPCIRCKEKNLTCQLKPSGRRQNKLVNRKEMTLLRTASFSSETVSPEMIPEMATPGGLVSPTFAFGTSLATPEASNENSPEPRPAEMSRVSSWDMPIMSPTWGLGGQRPLPSPGMSSDALATPISGVMDFGNMPLPGSFNRHASFGSMTNDGADVQIAFPNYAIGAMDLTTGSSMPHAGPDMARTMTLPTRLSQPAMGGYPTPFDIVVNPNDVLNISGSYFAPMADATFPGDFNLPNFDPQELPQESDVKHTFLG